MATLDVAFKAGHRTATSFMETLAATATLVNDVPQFFKPKFPMVGINDVDISGEFVELFTMGSEDSEKAAAKMTMSYLTFGLIIGGLFLFGTLTSVGWRLYKRKGGSFKSLFKAICAVLTCRVCKRRRSSTEDNAMELENNLLNEHEQEQAHQNDDEEDEENVPYKPKSGVNQTFIQEEELATDKSREEMYLDLSGGTALEQENAMHGLWAEFEKAGNNSPFVHP